MKATLRYRERSSCRRSRISNLEALDIQRSISLRYSENQFTIHMASDNGGINNATRFIYQLKGFNDKWIKTTTANPDITYMSLPSGHYTLCVRMLKDDGTMGEVESQLSITIASPWYLTWWAWLCYGLLVVLLLFGRRQILRQWAVVKEWKRQRKEMSEPKEADEEAEEVIEEAVLMDENE